MTATTLAALQGFTVAPASPTVPTRLKRARGWMILAALFAVIVALSIVRRSDADEILLSANNPGPDGARATAEVLRSRGVDVRQETTLGGARITDPGETTLAVVLPSTLADYQIESILSYPGEIVFVGVSPDLLAAIDPRLEWYETGESTLRTPGCDDPDAIAAERITSDGTEVAAPGIPGASVCFPGEGEGGPYVSLDVDGRRITLLANATLPMNDHLTEFGNAALTFRTLGRHPNLVWYLGSYYDSSTLTYTGSADPDSGAGAEVSAADILPPGTGDAVYALVLAVFVAAIWRGRRMGPLVTESLPVVVPSSETTRGRARLYRRARAYGRAAASLRAAAAERMGRRLGVPRGGDAPSLVRAVAHATGRDPMAIEQLVFGAPPGDERAMMILVQELDTLERQVHRP